MPSLLVLGRTKVYPGFRIAAAVIGVLAAAWLGERLTLIRPNPFNHITDVRVDTPFTVAASVAMIAGLSWAAPALRITTALPLTPTSHDEISDRSADQYRSVTHS